MNLAHGRGWLGLAEMILTGSADLHGARCIDRADLFDPDVHSADLGLTNEERWAEVQDTCVGCPVRGACWAWAIDQHSGRVSGPTAASVNPPLRSWRQHRPPGGEATTDHRRAG